jgi:hypothetical protein
VSDVTAVTDVTGRSFRIASSQSPLTRSIQALMIASGELRALVYRGPYQLAQTRQREALLHVLNTEYNTTIDLPKPQPPKRKRQGATSEFASLIAFLVVIDGRPELWYEDDDVPATVYGFVRGRLGIAAARRVTFRQGTLPPGEVPAS